MFVGRYSIIKPLEFPRILIISGRPGNIKIDSLILHQVGIPILIYSGTTFNGSTQALCLQFTHDYSITYYLPTSNSSRYLIHIKQDQSVRM